MSAPDMLRCYREGCDTGADLRGYNRITHGLYCRSCAIRIDRANSGMEGGSLYPLLRLHLPDGGSFQAGLIRVRSEQISATS